MAEEHASAFGSGEEPLGVWKPTSHVRQLVAVVPSGPFGWLLQQVIKKGKTGIAGLGMRGGMGGEDGGARGGGAGGGGAAGGGGELGGGAGLGGSKGGGASESK